MTLDDLIGLDDRKLALRLALTRRALGMSQKDFAHRAGLKTPAYNQYETATNRPAIEAAAALCRAHRLTLDWIYLGDRGGLRIQLADDIAALAAGQDHAPGDR